MVPGRQIRADQNDPRWTIGVARKAQTYCFDLLCLDLILCDDGAVSLLDGANHKFRLLLGMSASGIAVQNFARSIDQAGGNFRAAHIYADGVRFSHTYSAHLSVL